MIKSKFFLPLALGGAAALTVTGVLAFQAFASDSGLKAKLAKQFPNSTISSIDCKFKVPGLCEVVIGKNVFYSTKDARWVVVGSVLDLEKKVDVTDERLKQLASMDAATAKITDAGGIATQQLAAAQGAPGQPSPLPTKIDVNLPVANAVVHNPGAPIKLTVFSDYNCHFCKALFTEMVSNKQIEVTEYPIGLLSADSSTKAQQVLCSDNRVEASDAQFGISATGRFRTVGNCSAAAAAVEANTKFAAAHGISGTPTIIRADGTAHAGYLAQDALVAFGSSKS